MSYGFLDIAVTPSVRSIQREMGSDRIYSNFKGNRAFDHFSEKEVKFISDRDSFYMATVSESGWPYVQHRGGPIGFVKVLDSQTLAFADFSGNRQYISAGNITANRRSCLFMMDYVNRARLKLYMNVDIISPHDQPELTQRVLLPDYKAKIERIYVLKLEAFDWNCSQHIVRRFSEQQMLDYF